MIKKIAALSIFAICTCHTNSLASPPLDAVKPIADRLIEDTSFKLHRLPVREVGFPLIITPCSPQEQSGSTIRFIAECDKEYRLGVASEGAASIQIDSISYTTSGTKRYPQEIAYDTYLFENYLSVNLKKGPHQIRFRANRTASIGFVTRMDLADPDIGQIVFENGPVEQEFEKRYTIPGKAAFQKHTYAEWHYANATTLLGLLNLADAVREEKYTSHVRRFCENTLKNRELFARQYYEMGSLRTQNYRMFRRAMLDDTSAPALPFVELALRDPTDTTGRQLLKSMADFVMQEQFRLPDGTFVRPEPRWTVWSDDLFMSSAFLVRYAALSQDQTYLEEAVRQVIAYDRYLRDPESGLMYHGWNDSLKRHVGAFWGRANGWFAWAVSEVLTRLPASHPQFETIRQIHRRHLEALAEFQGPSGMWHQLLDDSTTYEESSATAIFVLTMARAVNNGWIDRRFARNALAGWRGLTGKFAPRGVVHGICRSMSINDDPSAYAARATADNDPRGLGAIFTAAVEISTLEQQLMNHTQNSKP